MCIYKRQNRNCITKWNIEYFLSVKNLWNVCHSWSVWEGKMYTCTSIWVLLLCAHALDITRNCKWRCTHILKTVTYNHKYIIHIYDITINKGDGYFFDKCNCIWSHQKLSKLAKICILKCNFDPNEMWMVIQYVHEK